MNSSGVLRRNARRLRSRHCNAETVHYKRLPEEVAPKLTLLTSH